MRSIGFFIIAMLLCPLFSLRKTMEGGNISNSKQSSPVHFKIPFNNFPSLSNPGKKQDNVDTNQLKQSSWYADAINGIQESEYEIKPVEDQNVFASPNRQQNLRSFYTADKFTLEPREKDNWKLQLTLKGVYSGKKKIYSPQKDAVAVTEKNKIQFNHNDEFTVEYVNSKEGVRQNFIIEQEPAGNPSSLSIKLQTNSGWFINKVHSKEIHFAKINGNAVDKKLTYNDLKVWDANHKELAAHFETKQNEIEIIADVKNAVYPVTIDPISTTAAAMVESNQTGAGMGISVASAGDVNKDGYSDVVVGAYLFDNMQTNEGAAFVFHGSITGITTVIQTQLFCNTANARMGTSVASAGDVNGDGFSDIIVGAPYYNTGTDGGTVFVYHGSPAGITATVQTQLFPGQPNAIFGWSVACAGDVNKDGWSDVIVGAYSYDDINIDEGASFVYHGSGTGILTTVQTKIELVSHQFNGQMGYCVASAGDVNGDGCSDIIVVANQFTNPQHYEGGAFVYLGSVSGIITTIQAQLECDQAAAQITTAACAGDVNGDGYSDVIIGIPFHTNGENQEGIALVFLGSAGGVNTTFQALLQRDQANANLGSSVASAGDVNGDGYSDVIVGAPFYNNGQSQEGAAFIYYGTATGITTTAQALLESNQVNGYMGTSVSSAGDVNGDGYSDVIVGAKGYANPDADEGAAFIYHGSPSGFATSPTTTFSGSIPNDKVGFSVASAGDVNGDGYSDVVVGAIGIAANTGVAYIFLGSSTGLSSSAITTLIGSPSSNFGYSVASAGDVNGDGYSDVVIGAVGATPNGAAYIFLGNNTGVLTSTPRLNGISPGDQFGISVAGAGDINGDGYGDVVVGATSVSSNTGAAYIFLGNSTGILTLSTTLNGSSGGGRFGVSVASAGDVNGDGYSDVIIGASNVLSTGAAYIFIGNNTGLSTSPATTLNGISTGGQFGVSVAGAGDINGDGYGDVVVGALGVSSSAGAAYSFLGNNTGLLVASTVMNGIVSGDQFGISIASAGDVNGDGYSDVIVGANNASPAGAAYIFPGSSSGLPASPAMTLNGIGTSSFGYSVASAGDVNGDGYSDIIAGAHNHSSNAGAAYAYLSNIGIRNNLRLYNSDLITPIQQSNMADPNLFGVGLYAKSFIGKQKGKLVWQTVRNGNPFSGSPITNSTLFTTQQIALTDLGLTGIELKNQIAKMVPTKATYIRARIKYDPVTAITGQVYGPWRYPEGFLRGRRDIGSVALPVKFVSFTAVKQNEAVLLKWITTDETAGINYEVQHSTDGINFTVIKTIPAQNSSRSEYEWLHANPAKGKNYYRIRAIENGNNTFTATRQVTFQSAGIIKLYPNPVKSGEALTIESAGNILPGTITVEITDMSGQKKKQYLFSSLSTTTIIPLPALPAGQYILKVNNGKNVLYAERFLVIK